MTGRAGRLTGFTVAELIVAMSISTVTLLSGYELFQALKAVGDRQSADLAVMAEVAHGLDTIREDLLHAVPRTGFPEPVFAGVNPDPEAAAEVTTLLEFHSLYAGHGDERLRGLRQMCRVSYALMKAGNSFYLYRSEVPVVGPGRTSDAGGREPILGGVERVKVAFHNGQTWEPSFSSNERLPVGVELTVTARGQAWPLSVKLPCGSSEEQL